MKFVLDTNTFSQLMKGSPATVDRLAEVDRTNVGVPQPVIAEIEYGIRRLPRSRRRQLLRDRLDLLAAELLRVDWDDDVSARFGEIKAVLERRGERIEDFDAAIAAHALAAGARLVTSDVDHMRRIPGLEIVDWST